ncbi:probable pyridoxal 5'-phosphate synthase subunit PDX2 isoform X1 [Magnolia sinica]|uniref:probable pyridoxal 5'-phosphate synthase subunit PDX2 isoform X1 n=1 Tax=Magnolia sinica TaxID=86752 RepID=UPI00265A32AA|nr:probable pyridoxal 5'-phosphate synthase subunit PDX2 isoform X1 [Magnolia sinica]
MPSVGVLALQGSFNEHIAGELLFFFPFLLPKNRKREEDVSAPFLILYSLYHPVSALRRIGVKGVEVRKAEQLENVNGLIIPGGESTTMAKLAHYHNLFPALRDFVKTGKPVWGTCAGLIFLADRAVGQKLGGQELVGGLDCTVHRNFFGSQLQSFETELLVPELAAKEGGPASFRGVFIRAPAILEAGPDVEVLAYYSVAVDKSTSPKSSFESQEEKTVSEEKVIVAVKQGNLLGTAFHPELTADTRWHSFFLKMVSEDGDPSWSSATTSEGDVSGYQQAIPNDLPIFQ